jgi:hypothetical protein
MPIFEHICKECDHQFEALVCREGGGPKCHGGKLAPQLSVGGQRQASLWWTAEPAVLW